MFIDIKTLLLGILTISMSQIIIKMIIEPVHEFKVAVSDLQYWILETSPQTMGHLEKSNAMELRKVATHLLSEMNSVPFYWLTAFIFNLPRKKQVISSCRYIVGLSHTLGALDMITANQNRVAEICDLMGIYNAWDINLGLLNIGSEL